jgi:hypothetical protein
MNTAFLFTSRGFLFLGFYVAVGRYEQTLPTLIPKVSSYAFAVPDSPSNIRFEGTAGAAAGAAAGAGGKEGEVVAGDHGHAVVGGSTLVVVKGGTLNKLVEHLTHPSQVDLSYRQHFLITFRSFCTPPELLLALMARYVPHVRLFR